MLCGTTHTKESGAASSIPQNKSPPNRADSSEASDEKPAPETVTFDPGKTDRGKTDITKGVSKTEYAKAPSIAAETPSLTATETLRFVPAPGPVSQTISDSV
jgi:hypothetical protein